MVLLSFFFSFFSVPQIALEQYELTVQGLPCYAFSCSAMQQEKPLVVFVHGSPGTHKDWDKYLKDSDLQEKFRLLAIDRAGYGKSISKDTIAFPDLGLQADVVRAFAQKFAHGQPVIVVGHSFGGPVTSYYAAKYPDEVQQLILLAPAISSAHEQPRFYNRLAAKKWVNRIIPPMMRISQIEMMNLPIQLEKMQPELAKITAKTWLFHGRFDLIAPYGNALYVKENFKNTSLSFKTYLLNNHFIPWSRFEDIKALLLGWS